MDKDVCLDRTGLKSVVNPVISQGSPGFINKIRRQPHDFIVIMLSVSGHERVLDLFSYRVVVKLDSYLKENMPFSIGVGACRSLFHYLSIGVLLGLLAKSLFKSTKVHLKAGEAIVILAGSAYQGINLGYNAMLTQCHVNAYWSPYALILRQVSDSYPAGCFSDLILIHFSAFALAESSFWIEEK